MNAQVNLPLSVDWLALSLRLEERPSGCPAGHRWAFYSPTNVWASRWCLFNEYGEKIFTLLFQPRQSIIHPRAALLEVANEWLYHGLGISGILLKFAEVCRFQIQGISRLDLAVDFNPDTMQAEIIRGLNTGKYYVAGKSNGNGWWHVNRDKFYPEMWQGRIPHDMNWGHKTSDVRWKLYYKTKELRDNASNAGWDKPYIVDMWRDVGLDVTNVWRLEASIHNCNTFNFMGERLTFDRFMHSGSDLFQALYTSRFTVALDEGHKDKTNDKRVPLLDVGELRDAFKVRRNDSLVEHNGRLTLLRHLVNDVQKEEVLISDVAREAVVEAIEKIMEQDRFERYFEAMTGQTFDDWREWLRVKAYYFGEEHLPTQEDDTIVEMALVEAGVIDTDPLGTPTSMSQYKQTEIQF